MKIKEKPEDFYVKEIIDLKSKNPGSKYVYFLMWKKNLSTIRAIKTIAKNLRISKKRIFFAGEKDKKTVSEQYIAVKDLKEFKHEYDFGNVKLKYVGSFDDPIRISDIIENYFLIKAKDVKEDEIDIFKENLKIFKDIFFNYFDEQRFGDIRYINHLVGKAIINRNWEEATKIFLTYYSDDENEKAKFARKWLKENWGNFRDAIKYYPKWLDIELSILNALIKNKNYEKAFKEIHKRLLKLFLHSYQSYLWNIILSEFIRERSKETSKIKVGEDYLYISKDRSLIDTLKNKNLRLIGYDLKESDIDSEFRNIYEKVIKSEKIDIKNFYFKDKKSLILKSLERSILTEVRDLKYEIKENFIEISFYLKKGSYATILIKHLFSK
ncbi:MAG: tRNA pseudouridine(13) synthase TruD [Nanopusillaceae archaeon]